MRMLAILLLACVGALGLAAAAGSGGSQQPTLAVADLRPLVATKPPKPAQLRFTVGDPYVEHGPTFTLKDYLAYTVVRRALQDVGC